MSLIMAAEKPSQICHLENVKYFSFDLIFSCTYFLFFSNIFIEV